MMNEPLPEEHNVEMESLSYFAEAATNAVSCQRRDLNNIFGRLRGVEEELGSLKGFKFSGKGSTSHGRRDSAVELNVSSHDPSLLTIHDLHGITSSLARMNTRIAELRSLKAVLRSMGQRMRRLEDSQADIFRCTHVPGTLAGDQSRIVVPYAQTMFEIGRAKAYECAQLAEESLQLPVFAPPRSAPELAPLVLASEGERETTKFPSTLSISSENCDEYKAAQSISSSPQPYFSSSLFPIQDENSSTSRISVPELLNAQATNNLQISSMREEIRSDSIMSGIEPAVVFEKQVELVLASQKPTTPIKPAMKFTLHESPTSDAVTAGSDGGSIYSAASTEALSGSLPPSPISAATFALHSGQGNLPRAHFADDEGKKILTRKAGVGKKRSRKTAKLSPDEKALTPDKIAKAIARYGSEMATDRADSTASTSKSGTPTVFREDGSFVMVEKKKPTDEELGEIAMAGLKLLEE